MSATLKPWVKGPLEIIVNAELQYRSGEDYDRRQALISFDNAIEVAISVYLSLNPKQRNNTKYTKEDVARWKVNFHSRLEFLAEEIKRRGVVAPIDVDELIWYHDHRNEFYHGKMRGVPDRETLEGIRAAAVWIVSFLFYTPDVFQQVEFAINARAQRRSRWSNVRTDQLIDNVLGKVEIADRKYRASTLLFLADPQYYEFFQSKLIEEQYGSPNISKEMYPELQEIYQNALKAEISSVRIEHFGEKVCVNIYHKNQDETTTCVRHPVSEWYEDIEEPTFDLGWDPDRNARTILIRSEVEILNRLGIIDDENMDLAYTNRHNNYLHNDME